MDRALFAAATGMAAQQLNLDLLSNNLANSDVSGFKGSAATFAALAAPGERGVGTASIGEHLVFTQGKLEKSNGPFDVAIDGTGFFVVNDGQGHLAYTRSGEFSRESDGTLRNAQGWRLDGVRIPDNALSAKVAQDGTVSITTDKATYNVGRIRLAAFPAPEHLHAIGGTLFVATPQAGRPHLVDPGSDSGPKVRFGMLEQSNVSIVEAMMQILAAQRAYEANAKGVQAADEMLRIANNLQRG